MQALPGMFENMNIIYDYNSRCPQESVARGGSCVDRTQVISDRAGGGARDGAAQGRGVRARPRADQGRGQGQRQRVAGRAVHQAVAAASQPDDSARR